MTERSTGKKDQVGRMFDDIAPTYDALNHILSLGIDRGWRKKVVRMVATGFYGDQGVSQRMLDVATGTGDLAIALARRLPTARITGVDISENMLELGRRKVDRSRLSDRVRLQTGDAEALDFADGEFEVATVAFGVRNFGDIPAGLAEMGRVLKTGGRCCVLEFSEPKGSFFATMYRLYFHRILPWVGRMVSRNGGAYGYLPRSVEGFPTPERFAAMLREAGFSSVRMKKLTFGVAYIYEAVK